MFDQKAVSHQLYHLVSWIDLDKEPTWLHLDHYRLRNIYNISERALDRSIYLLEAAGWRESCQKMEIDEKKETIPMEEDDPNWKKIFTPTFQKDKSRDHKQVVIKLRDNLGDARRKWCPVATCRYYGGKGLVDRKKHLKVHSKEFCVESKYFKDIVKALEEDGSGWTPCIGCKEVVG